MMSAIGSIMVRIIAPGPSRRQSDVTTRDVGTQVQFWGRMERARRTVPPSGLYPRHLWLEAAKVPPTVAADARSALRLELEPGLDLALVDDAGRDEPEAAIERLRAALGGHP